VLLAMLESEILDNTEKNMIALYNNSGDLLWSYSFSQDIIPNDFEDYSYNFVVFLLGVTTEENKKVIYCFANNNPSFPSITFKLDAQTGEEIGKRFWHPGHLNGGIIYDFNKDGVEELVVWGINNGLERSVMFSIDPQKLVGKAPTINRYDFYGIEPADFNFYILLPKTDYNDYKNERFNHVPRGSMVRLTDHTIYFPLTSSFTVDPSESFAIRVDLKTGVFIPELGDEFQEMRDKLVKSGELNYPLTNTPEFKEGLVNQLRFWNGQEFVSDLPDWNKK
jgi:hypothetical protein